MFRGVARKGLFSRLVGRGGAEAVAYEIADMQGAEEAAHRLHDLAESLGLDVGSVRPSLLGGNEPPPTARVFRVSGVRRGKFGGWEDLIVHGYVDTLDIKLSSHVGNRRISYAKAMKVLHRAGRANK